MDVSASILRETKVGIEVRAHRRHPDPSISTLSTSLLKRWKALFAATAPLAALRPSGTPVSVSATVASTSAEAADAASELAAVRDSAATMQVRQRAVQGFAKVLVKGTGGGSGGAAGLDASAGAQMAQAIEREVYQDGGGDTPA